VVDAARWARSDNEARLIIASSFQQRLVRLDDVDRVLQRTPNAKRRSLIVRTAGDCAGGSESLGELDLLNLCRKARLPLPTRQVHRRDRFGRRRYLDAVFEEWMVAIEVDGAQHWWVEQMWDDASRQNDLELAGYTVLRYPVFVVRDQPALVMGDLRQALILAGWTPTG
jgi:very-short-patch-repair endonuclease